MKIVHKIVFFLIMISCMLTISCSIKDAKIVSAIERQEALASVYYQKALEYAQDESYWSEAFEAFHYFKKAAELGHVAAQDRTGWGYQYGLGTERDLHKAAYWYGKAAEAGNSKAETSLGLFLYYGIGGEKDLTEGLRWTRRAAEQNYPAALNNMGGIYEHGKVVPQDYELASRYYSQAANLDYALAKSNLGILYLEGRGLEMDALKAYELFRESCTDINRWGYAGCYHMLKNYRDIGADDEQYSRAKAILEAACGEKQGMACQFTGFVYLYGWGVNQNSLRAADFFERGCKLRVAPACGKLGELYYYGDGVDEDMSLAEILLADACINDDEESCGKLSSIQRRSFLEKEPMDGLKRK